jgi:hypothetical protein
VACDQARAKRLRSSGETAPETPSSASHAISQPLLSERRNAPFRLGGRGLVVAQCGSVPLTHSG